MNLNTAPHATLQLLPTQLLRTLSAALPALVLTLTASTPAQAQTPTIVNICDRTASVRNAILAKVSTAMTPVTCDTVTDTMLSGITTSSSNQFTLRGLTSLKAGDFMGLTGITHIYARYQRITTLPADVFMGLDALTNLDFDKSSINTIEPNAFRGLPNLDTLNLARNEIPTPASAGMFVGLQRGLGTLNMAKQFREDAKVDFEFKYSLSLDKIVVTLLAGAPIPIDVTVDVVASPKAFPDNRVNDRHSTQFTPGQTHHVFDVDYASYQPARSGEVSARSTRSVNRRGVNLTISEIAPPTLANICARTDVVEHALLDLLNYSRSSCAGVTSDDLASITALDLSDSDISALAAGDFAGLTALTDLNLSGNPLTTALPTGIFSGLTKLTNLNLSNNQLPSLPATPFAGLTALTDLNLSDNLPEPQRQPTHRTARHPLRRPHRAHRPRPQQQPTGRPTRHPLRRPRRAHQPEPHRQQAHRPARHPPSPASPRSPT